ncbi:rCG39989, isoform CRA_a [Rattus norvegicus]|uniref:RCG39989, isoform CRA_a n=1 Tax=Rattus norvegicus TaxID=10116 RepID=A6I618_RAT|nr:rCG39989, isoform CRA_a [Rattus norvegicus]
MGKKRFPRQLEIMVDVMAIMPQKYQYNLSSFSESISLIRKL